jgi:hypothetical protein
VLLGWQPGSRAVSVEAELLVADILHDYGVADLTVFA